MNVPSTGLQRLLAAAAILNLTPIALGDTPPDIIFYGRNISASIRYTQWDGAAWSASAPGSNVSAAPDWVQAAGCPTRAESVILTIDASRAARVFHHIGVNCFPTTLLTASVGGNGGRGADVVYEQSSGDAIVAYWINAALKVGWRSSSSGTLSAESQLTLPSVTRVTFLRLVPIPGTDQIMMLALNHDKDLFACLWSGSAWGSVTLVAINLSTSTTESFAFAVERHSGEGLLICTPAGATDLKYRTWIGGVWSGELTGPAIGETVQWARLATKPNPSTNTLALGLITYDNRVLATTWDGSSWQAMTTCSADAGGSVVDTRLFDIAYTPGGTNALIAYAKSGQTRPFSRDWNGASWSAESQGPDTSDAPRCIRLIRGESGSDIHVLWSDTGMDLNIALWSGGAIGSATEIDGSLSGMTTSEPFGIIIPAADAAAVKHITQWNEADPR